MTQIPTIMPPGVDPYAWAQYLAQTEQLQAQKAQREQSRAERQGSQQNSAFYGMLFNLLQQGQQSQYEARKANEDRYAQILSDREGTRRRVLDDVESYGDSLFDDVERNRRQRDGKTTADMSRLGFLGSPSMKAAARIQNDRAYQEDKTRAKDSLLSQRIGADERLSNQVSDFMERRTDSYPDTSAINSLASFLGASGLGSNGLTGVLANLGGGYQQRPAARPGVGNYGPGTYGSQTFTGFTGQGTPTNYATRGGLNAAAQMPQASYAAPAPLSQQRAAATDKTLELVRAGADPWYSSPTKWVTNPGQSLSVGGNPGAFGNTQVVSNPPPAGTQLVQGEPVLPNTGYGWGSPFAGALANALGGQQTGYRPRVDGNFYGNQARQRTQDLRDAAQWIRDRNTLRRAQSLPFAFGNVLGFVGK